MRTRSGAVCSIARAVRAARRGCSNPSSRSASARVVATPAGDRGWSPARPASRTRRCGRCSAATDSRAAAVRQASRPTATSGRAPAICCTWTSPATRASSGPATPSPATARSARAAGCARDRVGDDYAHAIVDDHTPPGLRRAARRRDAPPPSPRFLERALALLRRATASPPSGVMTDNASAYVQNRSLRELLAAARHPPPPHPALPPAHQRQGLCLRVGVPSAWAARLPAPGGLTQAKGMSGRVGSPRSMAQSPPGALDLRSICRPSGCGRAGEADLIGDSRRCGCIDTEASLAGPASTLSPSQEATMIVGIDVHKHTHAAALLDERGGEIGDAELRQQPGGLSAADRLARRPRRRRGGDRRREPGQLRPLPGRRAGRAQGTRCLHVPAWRTHRERHRHGPGKTDPGDAIAIAQVVLTQARRARTGAGARARPGTGDARAAAPPLRPRPHPGDPAAARPTGRRSTRSPRPASIRCDRQRELRRLKRISFGDGLAERIAARCIRELARDIDDLNHRIAALDTEIAELLAEHGNPVADLHGAGTKIAAAIIAHAGDVRRFRDAAAFARFCGAAPIPCGSGQTAGRHRLHRGGNRQLNAALYRIAIVQQRHHPASQGLPRPQDRRRQDPPRSPPRPQTPPRQRPLPPPPRPGPTTPPP